MRICPRLSVGITIAICLFICQHGWAGGTNQGDELKEIEEKSFLHISSSQQFKMAKLLLRLIFSDHDVFRDLLCTECMDALILFETALKAGMPAESVEEIAITVCKDLHLFPDDVCDGMVNLAGPEVIHVLNNTEYDTETCCGMFFNGHCDKKELTPWSIPVPGGKPEPDDPEPILPAEKTLSIVHITDPHVDLQYDEGSAPLCDYPMCCRHRYGDPEPGDPVAGHWGSDDHCDIPLITLEDLIQQAALLKPDLVYFTGDIPCHDVWEQTHQSNVEVANITQQLLYKYFPYTPVFNTLGNHEAAPVNSFVTPIGYEAGFNMDWLYEPSADIWSLPMETVDDIKRGGFYHCSPIPGFRVVSVNMNYCNNENWWLLLDHVDPTGQLQWLIDTLAAAEEAGEKVHLLSHFPSGPNCVDSWNTVFNKIVARYESTIRAMFFGDRHTERLSLVYDPEEPLRPVAVGFVGPEACSDGHQPAFKTYTVDGGYDGATWSVIDMQTYTMNMTLANEPGGVPEYLLRYTSEEAYGTRTLTAASVDQLTLDMAADKELFGQYIRNVHNRYLEPSEMFSCPEDPDCHKMELCDIVNTDNKIQDACHHLEEIIGAGERVSK